ncbi:MAG: anthranilate phosphoribosyltransferase [Candidatus Levyibacteriota bacterium]
MNVLHQLVQKENLSQHDAKNLLLDMMTGKFSDIQIAGMLIALKMRGEITDEIFGFIQALRENMISVDLPDAMDVCGTGGDGKQTFNISTAVAFVVAGAGVKVAKHGNRAASSCCGSADVLEALGVRISLKTEQAENVFKKVGMVFLFAPLFHPQYKNVSVVRKELGVSTIFNYLGPFISPARVKRQLIGVSNIEVAEKLAHVAIKLGYERLFIVTGDEEMDEISLSGKTTLFEVSGKEMLKTDIYPKLLGFEQTTEESLRGGDAKANAAIMQEVLSGKKSPKRDIVILNSAFALLAAGKVKRVEDGISLAEESINSGSSLQVLKNLIKETKKYA